MQAATKSPDSLFVLTARIDDPDGFTYVRSKASAGPETIHWHLDRVGAVSPVPSRASIARILSRHGRVIPAPKKKPKSAYLRFEAAQPNECWRSDFTHVRLAGGDVEVITWLDDHSRMALHITAHHRVTGQIVLTTFRDAMSERGCPASTLTDNGMVYTVRHASTRTSGGRDAFEAELASLGIQQKNGRGNRPDPGQGRTVPADDEGVADPPTRTAHHPRPLESPRVSWRLGYLEPAPAGTGVSG